MRFISALCAGLAALAAQAKPISISRANPPLGFVLMGDSTTNDDPSLVLGWGRGFCASLLDMPAYGCVNKGLNGASSATYISSGQFNTALEATRTLVGSGRRTFVTISFGINDQKSTNLAAFAQTLTTMVSAVRAANAEPILISPLGRRMFLSNRQVNNTLTPWAEQVKAVAKSTRTLTVDLTGHSVWYINEIGETAAWRLNALPADMTHLNARGSNLFGRMTSLLLKTVLPALQLKTDAAMDKALLNGIAYY